MKLKSTKKDKYTPAQRQVHVLEYPCPICSLKSLIYCRLLLLGPIKAISLFPKPIIRLEDPTLQCSHGVVPFPIYHNWFSSVLQSFAFEKGYTLIRQDGHTAHFGPLKVGIDLAKPGSDETVKQ